MIPRTRRYRLRPGLTRARALVLVRRMDRPRDMRAFTYDPRTGKATAT